MKRSVMIKNLFWMPLKPHLVLMICLQCNPALYKWCIILHSMLTYTAVKSIWKLTVRLALICGTSTMLNLISCNVIWQGKWIVNCTNILKTDFVDSWTISRLSGTLAPSCRPIVEDKDDTNDLLKEEERPSDDLYVSRSGRHCKRKVSVLQPLCIMY